MPESETTIESKIGRFPKAPKLTEEAKHRVCELFAQFNTPSQVQRVILQEYGVTISRPSLCVYPRQKKWRPLVDRLRQEWATGIMDLPLAHKRGRMEELTRLYKRIERVEGLTEFTRITQTLAVLRAMREEMDEAKTHFTTIFATQIHQYSDEELLTRRQELLQRLEDLRGSPSGRTLTLVTQPGEGSDASIHLQDETAGHDAPQSGASGGTSNGAGDGSGGTSEGDSAAHG